MTEPVTKTGFMCAVDFSCELGEASGGVEVYASVEDLKERRKCWEQCGIVEVRVEKINTVVEGLGT